MTRKEQLKQELDEMTGFVDACEIAIDYFLGLDKDMSKSMTQLLSDSVSIYRQFFDNSKLKYINFLRNFAK